MNEESDLKILKKVCHILATSAIISITGIQPFLSCQEGGDNHAVGTRRLPTNSILNCRCSLVFCGKIKAHKKIIFKQFIVKQKIGHLKNY
jgi:hypothetical protein